MNLRRLGWYLLLPCLSAIAHAQATDADPWAPMRFMAGEWKGTAKRQRRLPER